MKRMIPILILAAGLGLLYPMQRHIDGSSPQEIVSDETLYLSGDTVKRMSLGMEGLAADIYWIRTVQYFGGKLIDSGQPLSAAATANVRMDLLAPLLNVVVTLDPHHIPAYRFGAIFLPERDLPAAIALLEKGIQENPNEWRLYQDIGYINWQAGNKVHGEMAALNELLTRYKAQAGQCPTGLRQFAPQLRAMKLTLNDEQQPVDPDGVAYELKADKCKVELAWESQIPR